MRSSAVRPPWISKPQRRLALRICGILRCWPWQHATGACWSRHDQKTMPRHFAAFVATTTSPGVLIIPQRLPITTDVEDLLLI